MAERFPDFEIQEIQELKEKKFRKPKYFVVVFVLNITTNHAIT